MLKPLYIWLFFSCAFAHASDINRQELVLDKKEVIEIVQNTAKELERSYLFPEKSQQVRKELLAKIRRGEFDRSFLFKKLKYDLQAMLILATDDSNFQFTRRATFDVSLSDSDVNKSSSVSAQILDKNIGYVELKGDLAFSDAESLIKNAFEYLSTTDALIIDLREAGPGSIEIAQYTMSFLFPPDTHLADIFFGRDKKQQIYSSKLNDIPELKQDLPVFILNSGFVAGPWEFFSFTLKHYDRATIVGDDTIGLGYMTTTIPVSKNVNLELSYAHTKHPVTNDNWQDIGVIADYQVKASKSLDEAYKLAVKSVEEQNAN